MSLHATTSIFHRSFGNQTRKLIMLCIADFTSDDTGTAWAYIDTLADRAECSRRSVQIHLAELESAGELQIYRNAGPNGSHRFRILKIPARPPRHPQPVPTADSGGADSARGCKSAPAICTGGGADFVPSSAPLTGRTGNKNDESESVRTRALDLVNSCRDAWAAAPVPTAAEEAALRANLDAILALDASTWPILRAYLAARLPEGSAGWQPRSRRQFITDLPDVVTHALDWHSRRRPRVQVPAPPPATDIAEPPLTRAELDAILPTS